MPDAAGARIAAGLDHAFRNTDNQRRISAGPFELELCGADAGLVAALAASFPASRDAERAPDARIAILEGTDQHLLVSIVGEPDGTRVQATPDSFAMWQSEPHRILHLFDPASRNGVMWSAEARMPEWAKSRPLLPIIHALAAPTAWVPVHAAAVGIDGRFLLVAGPSKSGKTTASLACARAGWTFAGDDFVLVNPETGAVEPIYVSARLRSEMFGHFDTFAKGVRVARTELLGELRDELRFDSGATAIGGGRVVGSLFPRRLGAHRITFAPLSPAAALSPIAFVTITELPGYREQTMPKLLKALKAAPLFSCDTGNDPSAIPAAFEGLLRSLPA